MVFCTLLINIFLCTELIHRYSFIDQGTPWLAVDYEGGNRSFDGWLKNGSLIHNDPHSVHLDAYYHKVPFGPNNGSVYYESSVPYIEFELPVVPVDQMTIEMWITSDAAWSAGDNVPLMTLFSIVNTEDCYFELSLNVTSGALMVDYKTAGFDYHLETPEMAIIPNVEAMVTALHDYRRGATAILVDSAELARLELRVDVSYIRFLWSYCLYICTVHVCLL